MASAELKRDDAAVEAALAQILRMFGRSPEELAVESAINKRMAADDADPMPPDYAEDAPAATAAEMREWNAGLAEDGEEPDGDPERVGHLLPHKRWLERKIARRRELRPQVRRELARALPARRLGHGRRMPRSRPNGRGRTRAHAAHGPPRRPGGDDPDGDDADDVDRGGSEIALSASATLTATGLRIGATLEFPEYEHIGFVLGKMRDANSFAFGDWVLWGEATFGEEAAQALEATGRPKSSLLEYVRVARQVQPSRRRPGLSWSHHQVVASREPDEQQRLLGLAERHGWSVEELRGGALQRDAPPRRLGTQSGPSAGEIVELVVNVGLAILRAATPAERGQATVPVDLLDRLANALGTEWRPDEEATRE